MADTDPLVAPQPPIPPAKSGYQTTEFWLTLLVVASSLASSLAGVLPEKWGAVAAAAASGLYAISRAMTKTGVSAGPTS